MQYFGYRNTTLYTILAFLDFFSDIKIRKYKSNNTTYKDIVVPIHFANREKFLSYLDSQHINIHNNKNENYPIMDVVVPHITVNTTSLSYDAQRHLNKNYKLLPEYTNNTNESEAFIYTPVPYTLELEMTILTKTYFDGFQILEQILPLFTPNVSLNIKYIPGYESISVPISITSTNIFTEDEISIQDHRLITNTITFKVDFYYFKIIKSSEKILKILENFYIETNKKFLKYLLTPTTENYEDVE